MQVFIQERGGGFGKIVGIFNMLQSDGGFRSIDQILSSKFWVVPFSGFLQHVIIFFIFIPPLQGTRKAENIPALLIPDPKGYLDLNLGTTGTLGQVILLWGLVLCTVGCSAASQTPTHYTPVAPPTPAVTKMCPGIARSRAQYIYPKVLK